MKHLGLGLGMLCAGLVYYLSTKDAVRRRSALSPAPLPALPGASANPMIQLYQRHPGYLRTLRAVQA